MAEKTTQQYLRSIDVDKKLISSIDNGIIILDDTLQVLYFNKWLEIHTSLKEENVLEKKIYDVFPKINVKTLQRKVNTALRMGTPTFYIASTSKYLIPIKINQIKALGFEHMRQDVSVIPFDANKKLVALIITDQTTMINTNILLKSNIKKVEELNKELITERKTVDERVLYLKIDKEHNITDASRAYLDVLGYEKIDIYSQNLFIYEKLTMSDALKEDILKHIQEEKVFKYEKITLNQEGKELWLFNTLVPDYDQNGSHIGFIIFAENTTSAKLLLEHQKQLLESSRTAAMGEMISMIAHQWRQPLSVINTLIATLRIKKELDLLDDEAINTSYTKIEKTVSYLSDTIDDFRNFFKKNKTITKLTVASVLEKSLQLLRDDISINEILYTQNVDASISLYTYQNELIQTLINILKNSIDAFKEFPKENQILCVRSFEEAMHIRIEIEDNAGGIPSDILLKVFEPYFSTKSKNGTGLGLYVCKTIIEEHLNGKLTMKSFDDTTLTTIELPKTLEASTEQE